MITSEKFNEIAASLEASLADANVHDLMGLATALNDVIAQRAYDIMVEVGEDDRSFEYAVQIKKDATRASDESYRLSLMAEDAGLYVA